MPVTADPPASPALPVTLRYGLPGLVLALPGIPLLLLVPAHFVDGLGLPAAAVGFVLLAARALDLLVDPLAGHACRSAGRLRLLLALGAPLLLGGTALLFLPAQDAGLPWLFAGALATWLGWSLLSVPLFALGATLPADDSGRARLASAREACVIAGTLVAVALPVAAGVAGNPAASLALQWWLLALLLPLAVAAPWSLATRARWGGTQAWRLLGRRSRTLFAAPGFRRLLGAYFFNALANAIPATLLVLYATHVLEAGDRMGLFLGLYLGGGLLALPAWLWLARRAGLARAWIASMAWAVLVFALVPLLGAGDVAAFALVCLASGLSVGADNALPSALQARIATGLRGTAGDEDAGLAFGWWGVATKLALAAGAALALLAIDLGGFEPRAGGERGDTALVLAYAVLPVLFKAGAIGLAWRETRRPVAGGGACAPACSS